jgi:hypothetical protein
MPPASNGNLGDIQAALGFWKHLGPVIPFFFPDYPFWHANAYLMCILETHSMLVFTVSQLERNLPSCKLYLELHPYLFGLDI